MLPVKNRRDREEKSVPPVFFLPVGEMKKCTEKEQKKMKKYVKNSLHFRGQNAIL
ncbi:hypothetical protein [Fusicatenibacter saccharivorans]